LPVTIPQSLIKKLQQLEKIDQQQAIEFADKATTEEEDFGRLLVRNKVISDEELLEIKVDLYKLPSIDLSDIREIPKEAAKIVPDKIISFYNILPFEYEDNILKVGVLNPEDINGLEALKLVAAKHNLSLEKFIVSYADFDRLAKGYKTLAREVGKVLEAIPSKEGVELAMPEEALEEITAEAPVSKVVGALVRHAVEGRASDIHIEPFGEDLRIRYRVDGVMGVALTLPKNLHSAVVTRIKILSELKIDETRVPQDGRFSTTIEGRKVDFRVSTLPTRYGEKVVMRILDPLTGTIDLPELGLTGRPLEIVERNMKKPFGSILITGPTGSGKSTTLAAIIRRMNEIGVNIITLEDPIEYYIDGVNQSQVFEEIGYSFSSGLRHVLRQDPDIIMVGEIRDAETAMLATHAALTGHIMLSTLHTNDATGVIPRLIDMEVEKYLLAPTLNLAIAQRLPRKLCQSCKEEDTANTGEERTIKDAIAKMPTEIAKGLPKSNFKIWRPAKDPSGCKECSGKAFSGRIAIFEVLEMTDQLEQIILTNLAESEIRKEAKRQGMISMFQDGILKVLQGITSMDELLQVAQEQKENLQVT
jgi:type IV pilus assembly protein PilB